MCVYFQGFTPLVDLEHYLAASLLLECTLAFRDEGGGYWGRTIAVTIIGPALVIRKLREEPFGDPFSDASDTIAPDPLAQIKAVLDEVLPPKISISEWYFQIKSASVPRDWRLELNEAVREAGTTNQGPDIGDGKSTVHIWANLRFRSISETRIAQALDARGLMFLPNCKARVTKGGDRVNREPDFLICYEGKWGVLEVDGEPFHPPSRAVNDHERDTIFQRHGVLLVKHYDAQRCREEPMEVVSEFLDLLHKVK